MKPFFSYYGAKYTGAKYYGPPRRDLVIEPFAGSAAYSTRWNPPPKVKLYDISEEICELWDFLIHSSAREIRAIPDSFETFEEVEKLSKGARLLVCFWISKGRAAPSGALSPWYFQYRNSHECRVWGPAVKRRLLLQKPQIVDWEIENLSYTEIPKIEAHWHVDPPYNNNAGRKYPCAAIDYEHLSNWCKSLPGAVDVCENLGADWLPFSESHQVVTSRGRKTGAVSKEVLWRRQ